MISDKKIIRYLNMIVEEQQKELERLKEIEKAYEALKKAIPVY